MDNQTAVEDIRWHESPCDWCRGWGFLIDMEEDGATHGVRDLSGRLALPGEYAVTVRRPARLGDRFADGQTIGCGACDEIGRVGHPTSECTPACGARLARSPAPVEHAIICVACGLPWITPDANATHCPACATIKGIAAADADAIT